MNRHTREAALRWALLAVMFVLGLLITPQYGESWDERQFYKYADRALESYSTWAQTGAIQLTGNTYDNYGPAYVMLTALGARLLAPFIPWSTSDLRHLIYFATFALGIWAFYRLCVRWLSPLPALGATLLLATQPVIWGHAFISPKDVPFLTTFVLTLLLGLEMADSIGRNATEPGLSATPRRLLIGTVVGLILLLGLFIATPLIYTQIENLVRAAASGQTNIFSAISSSIQSVDPSVYIQKYFVLFLHARAILVLLLALSGIWFWLEVPGAFRLLAAVAPAAITLGFSTAIRVLGPLAGLFVIAYALWKHGRRALPHLILYALLAVMVMYLTWPYLWLDPVGHFIESVVVMARYPWRGDVLFNGTMYASTALPASYLPVLLGIQFTETAWLFILIGFALAVLDAVRRQPVGRDLLVLSLLWCILPLVVFVTTRSPLYDNFRQVLFVLPPLFMLAGLAFQRLPRRSFQLAVIALAVLPGIIAGARLHPYEYIYYNSFIGGQQGAFRRYEMDYWGTSYREAAAYLNQTAPANAAIWVEGPVHLLQLYTRSDLKIYSTYEAERASRYDYVVALTRFDLDLQSYPSAAIDHVIEREGAPLTVIKKP
jgi:hypothetical protein